jgi:hypothetical protein
MTVDIKAFVDELEKISGLGAAKDLALRALAASKKVQAKHLKYPAAALAGIGMWETAGKAKRRYEIGKAYEEAQGG